MSPIPPGIYAIRTREEEPRTVTCPQEFGAPLYLDGPDSNTGNQKWQVYENGIIVSWPDNPPNSFASTTNPVVGSQVVREPFSYEWEINGNPETFIATIKTKGAPNFWIPDDVFEHKAKVILNPLPFDWVFIPVLE